MAHLTELGVIPVIAPEGGIVDIMQADIGVLGEL